MPDRSRTIKAIEPMGTDPAPMGTTSTMTTDAAIQIGGARPGDTATDLATTLTPTIGFGVQLGACDIPEALRDFIESQLGRAIGVQLALPLRIAGRG
ncbi:hypothetical protein AF336_08755 [Bradyrhizobium diazoefficiens]|nr:hypothetical protein AF336_08755 [Bradyrhizobium diazoefficiens]